MLEHFSVDGYREQVRLSILAIERETWEQGYRDAWNRLHQPDAIHGQCSAPSVEALAEAMTHVRGAHNSADQYGEGPPCEWCVLAAEQALAALARLSPPTDTGAE